MSSAHPKLGPIDPNNNYSVYATAVSLMAHFADSLLNIIDEKFKPLYGIDWQNQLVDLALLQPDQNLRDVQALLKELARNGQSQLRLPLSDRIIKKEDRKFFYDELANILAERNAWVHRKIQESRDELIGLAELIQQVSSMISISTEKECHELIRLLTSSPEVSEKDAIQSETNEFSSSQVPRELAGRVWNFGDAINLQFTSHSYLITEDYDVSDRITGVKLSDVRPETYSRMFVSLEKLRPGSRLRITSDGIVSAFFTDNWGFVDHVSAQEWFANHLS